MIRRIFDFFKRNRTGFFVGLASGTLVGTSWIPFPPWALVVSLTPLMIFMQRHRSDFKQIFFSAWACQLSLTLIGFHWIAYVSHEFGYLSWPISILILLLFAFFMHIYIAAAFWFSAKISEKLILTQGASLVLTAGLLALFEQFWPSIFSWNMGYPLLWSGSTFSQLADTIGFAGLSWVVFLINAFFAYVWLNTNRVKSAALAIVALVVFAGSYWIGLEKQTQWSKTDSQLNVLIAQANIGNTEKLYAEQGRGFQQFIINEFFNLSKQGLAEHPQADLLVWPESAFPDILNDFAKNRNYYQQLQKFISETGKPVMTGAYSKDPPEKPFRDDYNGVFLFNELGQQIGEPYHKTQLLIFGEYIPFGHEIPWLAKVNPGGIGWGRGNGPQVWQMGQHRWGSQVCYESLDPMFSASLAKKGAEILFNVTNDSWFGPRFEPIQHLYMTFARAIETRRPMVRSTNTGISSVMLANGTVLEKSPIYQKWVGLFEVPYLANPPLTFYSRFGQYLPLLILATILIAIAGGRRRA